MIERQDPYAPLTEKDIAAGTNASESEDDGGTWVAPAPSNAPRPPAAHPTRGKPSRVWHYRDKDSKLLFSVFRFDPPGKRKVFTPLTLWMVDGRLSWQWKHAPAPRPLYGLSR